jgi:DNA/RNA-binding domain of Phe-tRNA-synthetase-like protein
MYAMANCRISVLRGTALDEFNDVVDTGATTPLLHGLPAQIIESSHITTDPSTQMPRTVRTIQAALPSNLPLDTGDRIRDDGTGVVYTVQSLERPSTLGFTPDLAATLRRVTD